MASFLTRLLGLPSRIKFYLVVAIIVVGAAMVIVNAIRRDAEQDLRDEIEEQDQSAVDAADDAAALVEQCLDSGGVPDPWSGDCQR